MRTAASVAAGLLVALALVGSVGTATAWAHAARIAADPAEHAVLTVGPATVSATFNEPLQTAFAAMTVVGPDANLWSTGKPHVQGTILRVDVQPLGPAGTYSVNYRVISADGHPVSGSWSFDLTVPGTGKPGPPAPPADSTTGGFRAWPLAVGGLLLGSTVGLWWVLHRRP